MEKEQTARQIFESMQKQGFGVDQRRNMSPIKEKSEASSESRNYSHLPSEVSWLEDANIAVQLNDSQRVPSGSNQSSRVDRVQINLRTEQSEASD